jgi:hypothetical protein
VQVVGIVGTNGVNKPMKNKDMIQISIVAVIAFVIVEFFTGCTSTTVETDTLKITHRDFHPVGQAVETDVTWEGVGTLSTRRSNDGTEGLIEATGTIINPVVK